MSSTALSPLAQATTGAIGAVVSNALIFPLDCIITKRQTSESSSSSVIDSVREIYSREGLQGFSKGLGSDSISTLSSSFIYFFLYNDLHLRLRRGDSKSLLLSPIQELSIGVAAGSISKLFTAPLSNLTVRQQTSERKSLMQSLREIVAERGVGGLWSGYSYSIMLAINPAITYYLFELSKKTLIPRRDRKHPLPHQIFLTSAISALMASLITYPLVLIKTLAQSRSSHHQSIQQMLKSREIGAFYVGLESQLLKVFVSEGLKMLIKQRLDLALVLLHRNVVRRR